MTFATFSLSKKGTNVKLIIACCEGCLFYESISRLKLYLDIQSVNVHKLTYSWQVEEHSWYQEHQNRSRIIISWFETCFENLYNIPNAECSNYVVWLIPLRTIAIGSSCVINKEYHIYSWYKCKSNTLKKIEKVYASLLWLLLSNYNEYKQMMASTEEFDLPDQIQHSSLHIWIMVQKWMYQKEIPKT